MTAQPAAVLWDMDGTLLDSEKLWEIAIRELANEHGHVMTSELRHALIGASGPNALRIFFDGFGIAPTTETLTAAGEFLEHRVGELMTGPIPWRPGAEDALAMARAAGLRCGLVTNTKRSLTEFGLETLGRDRFEVSVCGDEVDQGKPAPDGYLRAAGQLGVDPSHCVAVEDSPTGVLAARAAGCAVIAVPCEVPVPGGPGIVSRDTLVGLTMRDLADALLVRD
ncbi:HAD family phosphatase [Nocardia callitridis]|uniref:HAD family phosphatase n=1 Tax=Nocardia callitridis TaxID=648753 RepID=A0ABP9KA03_9NOCA